MAPILFRPVLTLWFIGETTSGLAWVADYGIHAAKSL